MKQTNEKAALPHISVCLLGGFSVRRDNEELFHSDKLRTNKALQLLVLMLSQPQNTASTNQIVNALYNGDAPENPGAVCKNLVYRLRKILQKYNLCETPSEALVYENNTYHLRLYCVCDLEIFNNCWNQLPQLGKHDRFETCKHALAIYKGVFLGGMLSEYWASSLLAYFENRYFSFLDKVWEYATKHGCYWQVQEELSLAFGLYPYEESVYLAYIKTLYACKQYSRANWVYDTVCKRLLNDLGLPPPQSLLLLMDRLNSENENTAEHLEDVHKSLCHTPTFLSTQECNLHVFSHLYQAILGGVLAPKSEVCLVLCTLCNENEDTHSCKKQHNKASEHLRESLCASLQKGDVFAQYSVGQFAVLLQNGKESCYETMCSCVRAQFYKSEKHRTFRLDFQYCLIQHLQKP